MEDSVFLGHFGPLGLASSSSKELCLDYIIRCFWVSKSVFISPLPNSTLSIISDTPVCHTSMYRWLHQLRHHLQGKETCMYRRKKDMCKLQVGPWSGQASNRDCRDLLVSPSSQLQLNWSDLVAASKWLAWIGGKSFPTNLVNFDSQMTGLVDERKAVNIIYLVFCKAFDTVSHKVLIEELLLYRLDEQTVRWLENWLNCLAHRVVISGMKSHWWPLSGDVPVGQFWVLSCSTSSKL